MSKEMNPATAALLRGLGNVARRAVNRAAASIAEDIEYAAQGLAKRARRVVEQARCACACQQCQSARKWPEELHCENCGTK
jgi:hypothetical protein